MKPPSASIGGSGAGTPPRHAEGLPGQADGLAVQMRSVRKSFFGVPAVHAIDFDVQWGEVHALLGENGAGKSTLCSLLSGLYRPEAGQVAIDGVPRDFRSPRDALEAGVGMVHQHFRLVDEFTVAENIALGNPRLGVLISRRWLQEQAAALAERYGLAVDPIARISQLSAGERQRVEILKLLHRGVRILILDEPTAVLTPQEAEALFQTLRMLGAEGKAVVFVSHKLKEVLAVADRITVLRDGRVVDSTPASGADTRSLARLMVDRELNVEGRARGDRPGGPALTVRNATVAGDRGEPAVREVDLVVRSGQVVGVAGVAGNGQRELAEAIAGLRPLISGHVLLHGVDITRARPIDRIRLGLGFVPEDRLGLALAPDLSINENLILKSFQSPPFARGPFLSNRAIRDHAQDLLRRFDIRAARPSLPARLLSGGNLQRAILARELSLLPSVLIAASPTRGLDFHATHTVREILLKQREAGTAILLISEDLDEVQSLSDRVVVMYEGAIVGELDPRRLDPQQLGLLMTGHGGES